MYLTRLQVEEFRCFHHLDVTLPLTGVRIVGPNGTGKTSLLEAIYLLATLRSFRASNERQLIHRESGRDLGFPPYARLLGLITTNDGTNQSIDITITLDEEMAVARKRVKIDGVPRRATDAVGTLRIVMFSPEDLELVLGPPAVRRRYLDVTFAQIDRAYLHALSRYHRILEQRNSLLKQLATHPGNGRALTEQLAFWDEQLVLHGSYVIAARISYLTQLSQAAHEAFTSFWRVPHALSLAYHSSLPLPESVLLHLSTLAHEEAQAMLSARYIEFLHQNRTDELRRGITLAGPHRDDFRFLLDGDELADYGSRGMQRLAVVATKLGEIALVAAVTQEYPVLLLDDVLSELDPQNQRALLEALAPLPSQRILTATNSEALHHPALASLPLWTITQHDAEQSIIASETVDV